MRSQPYTIAQGANDVLSAVVVGLSRIPRGRAATGSGGRPAAEATRQGGWIRRVDAWFARRRQRDLEAYLAQSNDIFELEARIRDLGRRSPARYY